MELVRQSRAPPGKEGSFCGPTDVAEAAFVTTSEDQPHVRVERDLEVCCRYQGNEVQKAVPHPMVSLDAVSWFPCRRHFI